MPSYVSLGHKLPEFVSIPLFGDRKQHGKVARIDDLCWLEWQNEMPRFYQATQKQSTMGALVNHAGYKVVEKISFHGKRVLEIGPGQLDHIQYWKDRPNHYTLVDIDKTMLEKAEQTLTKMKVNYSSHILDRNNATTLPFEDNSFDMVLSFYSLEHIHPLENSLLEIQRVLKPGGIFAGAIPAEGGFAWGLGRFLTSRRWVKKNMNIDYDKIICWEHPNFADYILNTLGSTFAHLSSEFWPMKIPLIDVNLVCKFITTNPKAGKG
jgi:SAM-dependent methyltransferase